MNDLVSIITPSYNTARFLRETIECVLAQTYANWEMLIVDDCSTDETDDVVASFADERIRYFKNDRNRGAAFSRNFALREARGRWIAFLDSDDLWLPDKLEKQIRFMEENGYAFSYTNYEETDEQGNRLHVLWTGPRKIGKIRMRLFNFMGCLTVMYDREVVGLLQIADLKKRNDYAMWIQASKKTPAYLLPETLAVYRVRSGGSITDRSQSPLRLVKYHYALWRTGEKTDPVSALFWTAVNLVCGFLKKKIYRKPIEK
jgi:glycosyltransferase involved in cell wall biosynthesis